MCAPPDSEGDEAPNVGSHLVVSASLGVGKSRIPPPSLPAIHSGERHFVDARTARQARAKGRPKTKSGNAKARATAPASDATTWSHPGEGEDLVGARSTAGKMPGCASAIPGVHEGGSLAGNVSASMASTARSTVSEASRPWNTPARMAGRPENLTMSVFSTIASFTRCLSSDSRVRRPRFAETTGRPGVVRTWPRSRDRAPRPLPAGLLTERCRKSEARAKSSTLDAGASAAPASSSAEEGETSDDDCAAVVAEEKARGA